MEGRGPAGAKKKALAEDYAIYYHDEATLQPAANVVCTYAPKGQTPVLALHDTKGYQHVCLASSICATGELFFRIRDTSFKGEGIVAYLKELLAGTARKIRLIGDNASWHQSAETPAFLRSQEGRRLWVARTPPYAPALRPRTQPRRIGVGPPQARTAAEPGGEKCQRTKGDGPTSHDDHSKFDRIGQVIF